MPGHGLLSGARRTALETPDWPLTEPEPLTDPLIEARLRERHGETAATRMLERWEGRLGDVRTALGSALGSAGERVRAAVPPSGRAMDAGRSLGTRLRGWLRPLTAWLTWAFHPFWSLIHTRLFRSRRRAGIAATFVVIAVLLVTALPPLVTLVNALNDYRVLSTLGDDGLHHLLAAKDELTGSSGSSGSSASLGSSLSGLDQLTGFLTPAPPAAAANAPYQYLMQRQPGTANPVSVTVHPAPSMTKAGLGDKQFSATVDQNRLFAYGAPPTPPPAATPTPTPTPPLTPTPKPTPGAGGGTPATPASTANLQQAVSDLRAAQADFSALRAKLNNPDWILDTVGTLPGTKTRLSTVKALADVGYDLTAMGLEVAAAVQPVLHRAAGGALSVQSDLVTQADVDALQRALDHADGYLSDIESRLPVIDLTTMPLSAAQAATFAAAIEQLPKIHDAVRQVSPWVKALGWAMGVGGTRRYLVQTLDKAELRPSGGFTGEFGLLSITNGKLDPFTFQFADHLDYNYFAGCGCYGRPPDQYSWWPVCCWGLRDSNLSADFPTTAKINMDLLKKEGERGGNDVFKNASGGDVDGVVQFTTTAIAHSLRVIGPITVPVFNETVTADNLEDRLYYYQDTDAGIAKQRQLFPADAYLAEENRKHFLQSVTQVLQDKVKHLPSSELAPLAQQIFEDMKSKDLQVYVTNSQIEDQLLKLRAGGAVDTRSGIDGYLLVQANVSYDKDSPYVIITQHDDVTLDDKGGAKHILTITLYHDPNDPIYSQYKTYRDYVRIYVPPQARLIRGIGFDTGLPLCWAPPPYDPGAGKPWQFADVPYCTSNPYPDGELSCPAGGYGPGAIAAVGDGYTNWASDVLGPPPQTATDLPGRAMWGGFVVIPASCTAKLTLRWYVPHVARVG